MRYLLSNMRRGSMERSLIDRLGGPEVGILFLAGVIDARKRLEAATGGVFLVSLDVMDITLHIGGRITNIPPQHRVSSFMTAFRDAAVSIGWVT